MTGGGLEGESPREHIVNALQILRGVTFTSGYGFFSVANEDMRAFAAIRARLETALDLLGSEPSGAP